jgi:hypothetical protein
MDRPLWQTLIPLLLIGLAAHRAAAGFVLFASDVPTAFVAAYALEVAAALVAAVALWLGRPWSVAFLVVLGAMLAISSLLETFWFGLRAPVQSAGEVLIIALSTAALALVLHRELRPGGTRRGSA